MRKLKPWLIGLAVIGVLGIYAYIYRDWFKPAQIQIFHRVAVARPPRPVPKRQPAPPPSRIPLVAFGLDRKVVLTEVKVFDLSELATNQRAAPIWHLINESNTVPPLKGFVYGDRIKGMIPSIKGVRPLPLITNTTYRLIIEAGAKTGQHDFSLK